MRVTPAFSVSGQAHFLLEGASVAATTSIARADTGYNEIGPNGMILSVAVASGLVAGQAFIIAKNYDNSYVYWMMFDAEI